MKNKCKRIGALLIVIAWGIMILVTVITAFCTDPTIHQIFKGLMYTDIVLPVVVYAMLLVYRYLSKRGQ